MTDAACKNVTAYFRNNKHRKISQIVKQCGLNELIEFDKQVYTSPGYLLEFDTNNFLKSVDIRRYFR